MDSITATPGALIPEPIDAVSIHFAPRTGTEEEWNAAYARLSDYFRSYRLHNRIRRTQLVLGTLRLAAAQHELDSSKSPTYYAVAQAREMMKEWLDRIYDGMELTAGQIEGTGKLGFHLCDGPTRWPQFFMDLETLPDDMAEAMRSAIRTSGPRLQVSKMTPREIDLGLVEDVTHDSFDNGATLFLRYFALLIFVSGVLYFVYWLTK